MALFDFFKKGKPEEPKRSEASAKLQNQEKEISKMMSSPYSPQSNTKEVRTEQQKFAKDYNETQQKVKTEKTETAIKKKISDLENKYNYNIETVGFNDDKGNFNLYDYKKDYDNKTLERDDIKKQLSTLIDEKNNIDQKDVNALTQYNIQIGQLNKNLVERNKELSELEDRIGYQDAFLANYAMDKAKAENNNDIINQLADQYESYDDSFIERRGRNLQKITNDMFGAVANVVDIARDLGGEALASAFERGAKNYLDNGEISQEEFDDMMANAEKLREFDAQDPNTLGAQLRSISNQLAYDVANGDDGISAFIGQGLDSTANFLAQYALLGEAGALAMMSAQSGTQKYFENLERGYDQETAFLNGLLSGLISYGTEKIGMDNFVATLNGTAGKGITAQIMNAIVGGKSNLGIVAQSIASQGLAEGLEELVEGNLDYALDRITASMANGEPVEYNPGDIFYSFLVGGFSGALMGATGGAVGQYNMIVNTRQQYNNLRNDLMAYTQIRNEAFAKGEDVSQMDLTIEKAELALNNFEENSKTMGVTMPEDMVNNTLTPEEINQTLTEAMRPGIEAQVDQNVKLDALEENINKTAQDFLYAKGVNMNADEFMSMPAESRTKFIETANKVSEAFPNVNVGYSTEIGENAMVIKMEGETPTIIVNPNGETSVVVSAIHEVVHTLENTEGYNELFNEVFPDQKAFINKVNELSGGRYKGDSLSTVGKEALTIALTEDMMGDEGAQKFIDHMAKYNTSTAYKLFYELKNASGIFKDNSQLGKITEKLTNALSNQDVAYTATGLEYSKGETRKQVKDWIDNYETLSRNPRISDTQIPLKKNYNEKIDWEQEVAKIVTGFNPYVMATMVRSAPSDALYDVSDPSTYKYKSAEHTHGTDRRNGNARISKDPIDRTILENIDILYKHPLAVMNGKGSNILVITKATTKNGSIIVMPFNYRMYGDYLDFELARHNQKKINSGRAMYGKNNPSDVSFTDPVTGEDIKGKNNYGILPYIKDDKTIIYWAEGGKKNKNEVINAISNLLLASNGKTFVDPSIAPYFEEVKNLDKKEKQLEIIQSSNPMLDDTHTGIRSVDDIQTFLEATSDPDELFTTPDYTEKDIYKAILDGHIVVYSSHPIENGTFVTPSKMEAQNYAGDNEVYQKDVKLENVAWIDSLEGQYAPIEPEIQYSKKNIKLNGKLDAQIGRQKIVDDESNKIGRGLNDISGNDLSNISSKELLKQAYKLSESSDLTDLTNASKRLQEIVRRYRYSNNTGPKHYGLKLDTFKNFPEVLDILNFANEIASKFPTTFDEDGDNWVEYANHPENSERINQMRETWAEKHLLKEYEAKVGEQPKLIITMGLPGAGKSTALKNDVVLQFDADDIKLEHPFFKKYGGIASGAVHAESGAIIDELKNEIYGDDSVTVDELRRQGKPVYNIALPKIFGHSTDAKLQKEIDKARRKGYKVVVKLVDITNEDSKVRNASRFADTLGRLIPLEAIEAYGDNPYKNFISAMEKEENGDVEFIRYNESGETTPYRDSPRFEEVHSKTAGETNGRGRISQTPLPIEGETDGGIRNGTRSGTPGVVSKRESVNESEGSFSNGNETIQFSSGGENGLKALLNSQDPALRERGEKLKNKLTEAVRLNNSNATQKEIWDKTGWIKKSDGKWRFQFYDGAEETVQKLYDVLSKYEGKTARGLLETNLTLADLIGKDNVLLKMYPELNDVRVNFYSSDDGNYGSFNSGSEKDGIKTMPSIAINLRHYYSDINRTPSSYSYQLKFGDDGILNIADTFFHELQHAIQEQEGFEDGTNLFLATNDIVVENRERGWNELPRLRKALLDSGLTTDDIRQLKDAVKSNTISELNGISGEQRNLLEQLVKAELDVRGGNVTSEEALERYENNLGEIEAREEAERATNIQARDDSPAYQGYVKSEDTRDLINSAKSSVQFSRRTKVRPEAEDADNYAGEHIQRFTENIDKSQIFNKAQKNKVREEVASGGFRYASYINKVEVQRAQENMKRDGVDKTYDSFMSNNNPNMKSVVQGEVLVAELAKNNDPRWEQVASKLADDASVAGQFLQAYAIMQRLTPSGQLVALRRNLNRMQRDVDNRLGNRAPQLELNEKLVEDLKNAKDVGEAEEIRDRIYEDLENQVPRTVRDVINSWRYLAMLGNPRTHIRNIVGNAVFTPAVDIKNAIGAGLEKLMGDKLQYKTKAILNPFSEVDRALIELGEQSYDEYKGAIEKGQKYENRGFSDKTKLGRLANKLADANSALLDKEDYFFARHRYAESYAQFLKANNLNASNLTPEMVKRASDYAVLEAQRATYRDANSIAEKLSELERSNKKGLRMASYVKDAIMPFTKTPMNIVKRGVRYSPLGLLYTVTNDAYELANGKIDANAFIDNLAQGLTGSGVALMGALLTSMGLFRTKDDDKDRKQNFDKEQGEQDYAIDLSPFGINGTYTIDWATPVIMPFAIGSELYNIFKDFEGIKGFGDIFDAVADVSAKVMDPVMETSMLSSLQDALKSYSTEGGAWLGNMIWSMTSSYIQQMFPTIGGQIARILDDTRRTVYPNSGPVDKLIKQIYNKIPWVSKLNQPYINREGKEEKTEGGNWLGRTFLNMVSPGYYSSKDIDEYDNEMYRLYESTGSMDAFPSSTSKSVTYDKEKYDFTPEQYTQWHKTRWQTEQEYVNQFIDSDAYKKLTDEERVDTIKDIRSYAQEVAKQQFLKEQGIEYDSKKLDNAQTAMDSGMDLYQYYDYVNNAGTKQADKLKYLEESNLTEKEKKTLWDMEGYKTSYEDAYAKAMGKSTSKSSSKKKSSSGAKNSSGSTKSTSSGRSTLAVASGAQTVKKGTTVNSKAGESKNYLTAYSNSLRSSKPPTGGQTVVCPNCKNKVVPYNGRCPVCGTSL